MSHPVHPILVHFPIAFWSLATIGDIASIKYGERLSELTNNSLMLGVMTGIVAMCAGLYDLIQIKSDNPAIKVVNQHIMFAVLTWSLYAASLFLRLEDRTMAQPDILAMSFSIVGFLCLCISGWLGGSLVYKYGVGVTKS